MTRLYAALLVVSALGCTPIPAGPRLADAAKDVTPDGPIDAPVDPDAAFDGSSDTAGDVPGDVAADAQVDAADAQVDAAGDAPVDAPMMTGPRLTGTFVSSGVTSTSGGRLSGGFV